MKKIFASKYTWAILGAIVAVILYKNWGKTQPTNKVNPPSAGTSAPAAGAEVATAEAGK